MLFSKKYQQRFVTAGELQALLEKLHPSTPIWVCSDFGIFHATEDLKYACLDNGQYAMYAEEDLDEQEIEHLENLYEAGQNWQQEHMDF